MNKKYLALGLVLVFAFSAFAGTLANKRMDTSRKTHIAGKATEDLTGRQAVHHRAPAQSSLDLIGTQYEAGTTWYDYQHNGTAGKMIGVDNLGFVHVVWMNGQDEAAAERHVYYHCWDPTTQDWSTLIPEGGVAIDNATRAGYVASATTPDGFCYPAFHAPITGEATLTSQTSQDFIAAAGAYTAFYPTDNVAEQVLWPKIALDDDSVIHGVSTTDPENNQAYYYWRGTPAYSVVDGVTYGTGIEFTTFNNGEQMVFLGNSEVISPDIAASPVSDRVAVAFNDSRGGTLGLGQINNSLMVAISEDGGLNWAPPFDLTDWIPSDQDCPSQDTMACNGDTLRPYTCISMLFDYDDNLHIAFTTRTFYEYGFLFSTELPDSGSWPNISTIWHWSEYTDEFSSVVSYDTLATFANGDSVYDDNAWQLMVQRPSLAIDTATGWMYCAFAKYDAGQVSANSFMSADAWIAASCNMGRTWYNPINLTSTVTEMGAVAGECNHERDITLADLVTYDGEAGYLHVEYELDYDVGAWIQTPVEGVATLNPIYYLRVPLADLDFVAQGMRDFTGPPMHIDSSQHTGTGAIPFDPTDPCRPQGTSIREDNNSIPKSFQLFQNFPNPFNPTTNIQFDLINSSVVTLKVFNVLGEEVATLVNGEALNAGAHTVQFDAANLSSGVYMYRLESNGIASTRKMILMK